MESITSFFFNIIPGALLIFILEKYSNFKIVSETLKVDSKIENDLFWIIIFSIFLGFLFQACSKWVKEHFLYQLIWCKVKEEDPHNFAEAEKDLSLKKLLPENEIDKLKIRRIFFTMDNYISLNGGGKLLPHFASRLAYWFNLFWVSLIIISFSLLRIINDTGITLFGIVFLVITAYETWVHLQNHYDILLKTFVSYIKIDKENVSNLVKRNQKKQ